MNSSRQREVGFSLIEVLISLAILVIILGGVSSLAVNTIRTSKLGKQESEAYAYAQEQLEQLKQIRNTNLVDSNNQTTWRSGLEGSGSIVPEGDGFRLSNLTKTEISPATGTQYTCRVTVYKEADSQMLPDQEILKAISVVEWQERDRSRRVFLITYLTDWLWGYND